MNRSLIFQARNEKFKPYLGDSDQFKSMGSDSIKA